MKKQLIVLAGLLFCSVPAFANDFEACTVEEIVAVEDSNVHVRMNCPAFIANTPACATALTYIGFDGTTLAGKRYFALLSMAMAMNLKVAGTVNRAVCSPQGNVALLNHMRVYK